MGNDQWRLGQYEPVDDELDATNLTVSGRLPDDLRGVFLRNGPNPAFDPLGRYHLFDGDGMVHGLYIDDEGVSYRNRWVRTAGFVAEEEAGHALFGGLAAFQLPPPEVLERVGPMKNTANTHVIRHADRVLALMEAAKPVELTVGLETVGEYDYDGQLSGPMTAHPKVDPASGELIFFGYSPMPPYLRLHTADAAGALTWSTEVVLPGPVMMHDFAVTATHVVIFDLPAVFDLDAMMTGQEGIRWDPDHGARIGVLARGAPGHTIQWMQTEPFWVFHFLNAYDDADGSIVVTGCRADRLNTTFGDKDLAEPVPPRLYRWRIDTAAGVVRDEMLDDQPADFPRIDDRFVGQRAPAGYLAAARHWTESDAEFDSVIRYDLATGTAIRHHYGDGVVCGEPVVAAATDDESDGAGYVLNWVHDRTRNESAVVILDGRCLDELARVHLPRRVPAGFHGSFLPS